LYLLDTNVISEMRKGTRANAGVRKFFADCKNDGAGLLLAAVTVGELRCGVERIRQRGDMQQADTLEHWLQSVLEEFHEQVLDFDVETAQLWGVLQASGRQHALDNQIAATALLYGLTVVTRNESDFRGTGVKLLNPWS
jgi:predicted nucleic acid-binding protein